MDRLWAPWRIKYISKIKRKGCLFCRCKKSAKQKYVLFKTERSVSMLNIFPYNNGHLLIAPLRHVKKISQLTDVEILDLFKALTGSKRLLDRVLRPHGYNIGINISRAAGAGIPGHLHLHIVPRFEGDTNFMPVLYETRVISQSLDELYKKLKNAYAKKD
ncbi:MAG TPA: HIT domain-containing protein [Candidatus Omnitrophota bacterium]|nr:HIT domain-containing protein [Candidatus Omnitrophota bacterium]